MPIRILIVEDDPSIGKLLRRSLLLEEYEVELATTGYDGLDAFNRDRPDMVILDLMLPGIDGIEVCRRIREVSNLPIFMITARSTIEDRVLGLDSGADDYSVKPFDIDEVLARVRALLRRVEIQAPPQILRFADLVMDVAARSVHRGEREVELTAREFDILELFLRHPNQVLTRAQIYDDIWSYDFGGESRLSSSLAAYLRTKLRQTATAS
ncbi:MAG: response regulator transcription factor [Caldilineales bacterium]|nr:response regulator transcription factor [Caldilineales bacterium]